MEGFDLLALNKKKVFFRMQYLSWHISLFIVCPSLVAIQTPGTIMHSHFSSIKVLFLKSIKIVCMKKEGSKIEIKITLGEGGK
jgi:hypothetical protein